MKGFVSIRVQDSKGFHYSGVLQNGILDVGWDTLMGLFDSSLDVGLSTHGIVVFGDSPALFDKSQTGLVGTPYDNADWSATEHLAGLDEHLLYVKNSIVGPWNSMTNAFGGSKFGFFTPTDDIPTRQPRTTQLWVFRNTWTGAPGGVIREAVLQLEYTDGGPQVKPISRISLNSFPLPVDDVSIELVWWFNMGNG